MRRTRLAGLALVLASGLWAKGPAPALGPVFLGPSGAFRIQPVAGLAELAEETNELQAVFVGEVPGAGPASINVLFFPSVDKIDLSEAALEATQREVERSLQQATALGARPLPPGHPSGRGLEMEFTVMQQLGEQSTRMYMLQRQVEGPGGLYNLTAYCLDGSRETLAPALKLALDSFQSLEETPGAGPEELVLDATFRFAGGEIEKAVSLASRVGESAPFPARVASLRIRMAGLMALGRFEDAESLVRPLSEAWVRDGRPFSLHYAWLLGRGVVDFQKNLARVKAAGMPPEGRAALAAVALATWAGPPDQVPPHLTRVQDQFYRALAEANEAHPKDDAKNWAVLQKPFEAAVKEVDEFLVRYEGQVASGEATPTATDPDFAWLTSSLSFPLVAAVRAGDKPRYQKILQRYEAIYKKVPGAEAVSDPLGDLRIKATHLMTIAKASFRELDYRLWQISGQTLFDRTLSMLRQGGLKSLEATAEKLRGN